MQVIYRANDGTEFYSEGACQQYESNPRRKLEELIQNSAFQLHYDGGSDFKIPNLGKTVLGIIDDNKELVRQIIDSGVASKDDWVVNTSVNIIHPDPLTDNQKIEVICSDGALELGVACDWKHSWDTTNRRHIVKYRAI